MDVETDTSSSSEEVEYVDGSSIGTGRSSRRESLASVVTPKTGQPHEAVESPVKKANVKPAIPAAAADGQNVENLNNGPLLPGNNPNDPTSQGNKR